MGNSITQGTVINEEGDFAAFSGFNPGFTEMGAFVFKNEGGTWSQFGSTGRVKEDTASVTGYTGSFIGFTIAPTTYCNISENAHFLCIGNDNVGIGGWDGVGYTGAAYIFEFDTGTTGYGTPTQQLNKPRETKANEFFGYGSFPTFGPAINTGTTDTLMISNEGAISGNVSGPLPNFNSVYDIWEYNGSYWVRNATFSYSVLNTSMDYVIHNYNAATKTVFTANNGSKTIISRTFSDGNLVTTDTIATGETDYYHGLEVSSNGLMIYAPISNGTRARVYTRNSVGDSFTLFETITLQAPGGINVSLHSNGNGDKLVFRQENTFPNSIAYNIPPETGAGGQSQHAYISNGSDGTLTEGGVGVNNPNAKSNVKYASGGGYGGSSNNNAASINTGSGGAGRVPASGTGGISGTAGSSGNITVRRWNSGIS